MKVQVTQNRNMLKFKNLIYYFLLICIAGCCKCTREGKCPGKLTSQEKAIIPYQEGDSVLFFNKDKTSKIKMSIRQRNEVNEEKGGGSFDDGFDCNTTYCYSGIGIPIFLNYFELDSLSNTYKRNTKKNRSFGFSYQKNVNSNIYTLQTNYDSCLDYVVSDTIISFIYKKVEYNNVKCKLFKSNTCIQLPEVIFLEKFGFVSFKIFDNEEFFIVE
jgi:hypothetical protein